MNSIIEVKDITFTYSGAQRHALERVSLAVAKVVLATDCRNDPRTCTKGVDCSTPIVHVREWRVYK